MDMGQSRELVQTVLQQRHNPFDVVKRPELVFVCLVIADGHAARVVKSFKKLKNKNL